MEFNAEEFKEFIIGLADSFDKEDLESPLFRHFFENIKYYEDADDFGTMVIYPLKKMVTLVLEKKFNKSIEVAYLFWDYAFLESNVSELCSQFYGGGCSVDRGRFIVKSYIKWKETGIMPEFNWKQEYTFHYPEKGTMKQWLDFVAGVERLKYGYNKEYLLALKELMEAHKECVKEDKGEKSILIDTGMKPEDWTYNGEFGRINTKTEKHNDRRN